MAIYLTQEPEQYGLAFNDNTYVIKTTNYTPTVRLKIDILPEAYPTEPKIGTVRVYPVQGNSGTLNVGLAVSAFFDPSRFLQSYLDGVVDIGTTSGSAFFYDPTNHKEYRLKITEEDKDSQGVYQSGDTAFTNIKSVWNGVRNQVDWLDFNYVEYNINGFSLTNKFLTDSPRTIKIDLSQRYALSFILTEKLSADVYTIKSYSGQDATGSLLATGTVNNNLAIDNRYLHKYLRIPVGPLDIETMTATEMTGSTPSTVLVGASSYTIQLRDNTNAQTSELFIFNIGEGCSKYTPVRVHWLNRLGGFDAHNFNMKSIESTGIKKGNYDQQTNSLGVTTYNYQKKSRGTTTYNVELAEKVTINSDYLTEEESLWMEDLATSPSVYIEKEGGEFIAVNLDARKIQRQTSLNDKLMQYTFELSYSIKNRRQRG
jgi:hypothetical protein